MIQCAISHCLEDLLMGTSTEAYMIKNPKDIIPTAIMAKGKFHFIGRILQLLEVSSTSYWYDAKNPFKY